MTSAEKDESTAQNRIESPIQLEETTWPANGAKGRP